MYIGGIGGPVLLIVVGAIMRWATTVKASGFNIQLAGLIIFIVGIVALVISVILLASRRRSSGPPSGGLSPDPGTRTQVTRERVVREYPADDHMAGQSPPQQQAVDGNPSGEQVTRERVTQEYVDTENSGR